MTFYNTINLSGAALSKAIKDATRQEDKILALFRAKRPVCTSHEVKGHMEGYGYYWPRSSIVRSLNTLCDEGEIEQTGEKRTGPYGKPCVLWRVVDRLPVQASLFK